MTAPRSPRLVLALTIALAAAGCAAGGPDPTADWSGGGRADGFGDGPSCASEAEMVAGLRAQLMADEPDFYNAEGFWDGMALSESIGDLNGDGIDDLLVFPGWSYAGPNVEQAVYLSDESGCATVFAGHFGASSVTPAEDGAATNGVRDLTVVNNSGCEAAITRYTFDGARYVEAGTETANLCEDQECSSDAELIAEARAQLIADEPDFYTSEGFSDETALVERDWDLNGDGVQDALVFPGWSYAGANTEQAVYLSDADGCATAYAGHFGASSVAPAEDGAVTNGASDLTVVNTSACEATISRYTFDGARYVEAGYTTENLCDDGGDPMP